MLVVWEQGSRVTSVGYRWMDKRMKGWMGCWRTIQDRRKVTMKDRNWKSAQDRADFWEVFVSVLDLYFLLITEDSEGWCWWNVITIHHLNHAGPGWGGAWGPWRLLPAGSLRWSAGHQRLVPASSVGSTSASTHLHLPVPALSGSSQHHPLIAQRNGGNEHLLSQRTDASTPDRIIWLHCSFSDTCWLFWQRWQICFGVRIY